MGKFLKDKTADRLLTSLAFTESFPQGRRAPNRRVVRTIGGGSSRVYIEVTAASESTTPSIGLCSVWPSYTKFANGDDPTETDASYLVPNSTSNALADGDTGYATKEIDDGDVTYIIEAYLLV